LGLTFTDFFVNNASFFYIKWQNNYNRVNIGGISCGHSDYYNSENFNQKVLLPKYSENSKDPLCIDFFYTGTYQDSVSGYGGSKHCLIPSPKHIIIDRDEKGNIVCLSRRTI